ncbi:MAG: asparagine synthase (glutamine-hydrolyzing) [Rhodospirillales bacterium]|nr:asparagine synthase (glutamine-hydrolyzing) [Rhodospirillales bacterium]
MCGIAGIMTLDGTPPAAAAIDAMARSLAHRGPDGEGRHFASDVGFAHNRLAIIDLETGDQPLRDPNGAALVANGEIYNHVELRASLSDEAFATRSDCEPPLALYRREGASFVNRLRGMYALALHDPKQDILLLARDPFGIKPLYYAETSRGLLFASEPQAINASGLVPPAVRPAVRGQLLQLQFTTGRETIFEGIERVLPGETLIVKGGRIIRRHRIKALPDGGPEQLSEDDALDRLETALRDSVDMHQRSDVPYGMFLSGGIDSTAVLSMMAELNERPVRAFTIGFPGAGVHDERAQARSVARSLGAEHEEISFTEDDFWALLPRVAAAMDDPAADYATLPTFRLAEVASTELKVILSGEGGDELFGGYGRYRSAMRPRLLGGRPMRRRGTFDGLGVLRDDQAGWRGGIAAAEAAQKGTGRSRLQAAQAVDCADWLPNDLLTKLDRCLMAHGMEGRVPFLDPVVAEAAFRLPDRLKVRDGLGKWILRRWLALRVADSGPFARKKGFTVPVEEWIAAQGARLGPMVAGMPGISEICAPDAVLALFATLAEGRGDMRRAGFAAWTLLFYALWHRRHILGRLPEGDAFEALSAAV